MQLHMSSRSQQTSKRHHGWVGIHEPVVWDATFGAYTSTREDTYTPPCSHRSAGSLDPTHECWDLQTLSDTTLSAFTNPFVDHTHSREQVNTDTYTRTCAQTQDL
jgi:hypothetical protein